MSDATGMVTSPICFVSFFLLHTSFDVLPDTSVSALSSIMDGFSIDAQVISVKALKGFALLDLKSMSILMNDHTT